MNFSATMVDGLVQEDTEMSVIGLSYDTRG